MDNPTFGGVTLKGAPYVKKHVPGMVIQKIGGVAFSARIAGKAKVLQVSFTGYVLTAADLVTLTALYDGTTKAYTDGVDSFTGIILNGDFSSSQESASRWSYDITITEYDQ